MPTRASSPRSRRSTPRPPWTSCRESPAAPRAASLTTVDQASIDGGRRLRRRHRGRRHRREHLGRGQGPHHLDLPGAQASMISQAEAANPNTVVYLETVGEVNLSGFQNTTPALLWSSYNGEEQGSALADVLLGKVDPSGHLPFSWYAERESAAGDHRLHHPTDRDHRRAHLPVLHRRRQLSRSATGCSYTTSSTPTSRVNHTASTPTARITVKAKVKQPRHGRGLRGAAAVRHDPVRAGLGATTDQAPRGLPEGHPQPGSEQDRHLQGHGRRRSRSSTRRRTSTSSTRAGTACRSARRAPTADIKLTASVEITGTITQTPTVVNAKPIETGDAAAMGSRSG